MPLRTTWSPLMNEIMVTLDSCGRSDLADELENRIKFNFTASEILGDFGLFLIHIKQTEKVAFEKIERDYEAYFKHCVTQGLFMGIDY
jgi:hypothetical protein